MKLLRTMVILILVVGAPAMSWYYLSQGAGWRISGLDAIASKTPVAMMDDPQYAAVRADIDKERVYTIASNVDLADPEALDRLNQLADQFSYREDLIMLYYGSSSDGLAEEWTTSACESSNCTALFKVLFPQGMNTALVDDSSYLRRSYDVMTEDGIHGLVEHSAILFPVEKRAKIELKRGTNQ